MSTVDKSSKDWIFSDACQHELLDNGIAYLPIESMKTLIKDVGINQIEGSSVGNWIGNMRMILEISEPFVRNNDREGWDAYAKEINDRRIALGVAVPEGYK